MGERRTIDPACPGVVEIELDPGLEDTRCIACQLEQRARTEGCPHSVADREAASIETETQQVAQLVGRAPRSALVGALRRLLGRRPWWATAEGRARKREEIEREEIKREARERER